MEGLKLEKTITYEIEVIEVSKEVPEENVEDFKEWLESNAIRNGLGNFAEYYDINDDWKEDIYVFFKVKIK